MDTVEIENIFPVIDIDHAGGYFQHRFSGEINFLSQRSIQPVIIGETTGIERIGIDDAELSVMRGIIKIDIAAGAIQEVKRFIKSLRLGEGKATAHIPAHIGLPGFLLAPFVRNHHVRIMAPVEIRRINLLPVITVCKANE